MNSIQARHEKPYHILVNGNGSYVDIHCGDLPFGRLVFLNCVELITDLYSEVVWSPLTPADDTQKYRAWKTFLDLNGQRELTALLAKDGYVIVGYKLEESGWTFWQMQEKEYMKRTTGDGDVVVLPKDPAVNYYVLKSPAFENTGVCDREWCAPVIEYINNALNASNTVCKRLGTFVVASPKLPASAAMPLQMTPELKKDIEAELQKDYGALKKQNQIMLLPSEMTMQTVNLAGLDQRTQDRVLTGVKVIADRLKVPANQIALIDATSSKTLSNGTELREGDLAKYRTFRRLLNSTFYDFATELGLRVNYRIENEPKTVQGQTIEQ